ncbi:uncharacterized protein LOC115996047 [Ipomoea triloba]|uniref:uncharacterized protein LOC115996047 n=1 Tax=Ipomoea triloba TaxID=35885 RepID=UPI00125D0855|nr:uncharacterized protein LOC115996047 [Ipomoea triloba]
MARRRKMQKKLHIRHQHNRMQEKSISNIVTVVVTTVRNAYIDGSIGYISIWSPTAQVTTFYPIYTKVLRASGRHYYTETLQEFYHTTTSIYSRFTSNNYGWSRSIPFIHWNKIPPFSSSRNTSPPKTIAAAVVDQLSLSSQRRCRPSRQQPLLNPLQSINPAVAPRRNRTRPRRRRPAAAFVLASPLKFSIPPPLTPVLPSPLCRSALCLLQSASASTVRFRHRLRLYRRGLARRPSPNLQPSRVLSRPLVLGLRRNSL